MSDNCPKCGAARRSSRSWYFLCGTYDDGEVATRLGESRCCHSWACDQIAQLTAERDALREENLRLQDEWPRCWKEGFWLISARDDGGRNASWVAETPEAAAESIKCLAAFGALVAAGFDFQNDLSGASIQEWGERTGVYKRVKFDPEIHADPLRVGEAGCEWFVLDVDLSVALPTEGTP